MPDNPQSKADERNRENILATNGALLDWVVRDNSLLKVARAELTLAERRYISALTRNLAMIADSKSKAI